MPLSISIVDLYTCMFIVQFRALHVGGLILFALGEEWRRRLERMRRGFQLSRDLVKASFIGTTITNSNTSPCCCFVSNVLIFF